jgi:hypothetical protein
MGFVIIGGAISYTNGPQSLSYNHLNCLALQICLSALLLLHLATQTGSSKLVLCSLTGISGGCLVVVGFIKPSTFIGIFPLAVCLLVLLHFSTEFVRFKIILFAFLAGVFLSLSWYFSFVEPYKHYADKISIALAQSSITGYGLDDIIFGIRADLKKYINIAVKSLIWSYLIFIIYYYLNKKSATATTVRIVLIGIISIVAISGFSYGTMNAAVFLLTTNMAIILWLHVIFRHARKRLAPLYFITLCILYVTPYIGAFGTNHGLLRNALFYISFWFALVAALWDDTELAQGIGRIAQGIVSVLALCFFYTVYIDKPYFTANLLTQQVALSKDTVEPGLLVESDSAKSIAALQSLLLNNGYKSGDHIIGFGDMLGFIYMSGGRVPYSVPAHIRGYHIAVQRSEKSLSDVGNLFIIAKNKSDWDGHTELKKIFPAYPEGFSVLGSVTILNEDALLLRRN